MPVSMFHDNKPFHLAIFASGTGTNARNIIEYFHSPDYKGIQAKIELIVSNKENAGVLDIASKHQIKSLVIGKDRFMHGDAYLPELKNIDFIVLAGFLWKIPHLLVKSFKRKIINIHPALLPKFGGQGMYGMFVHEEVIKHNETETGITIHYIDENYDEGDTILQARCIVEAGETPAMIARKVRDLEHYYLPRTIESLLNAKSELNQNDKGTEKS